MELNQGKQQLLATVWTLVPARFADIAARMELTCGTCHDRLSANLMWLSNKDLIEYADGKYHVTKLGRETLGYEY